MAAQTVIAKNNLDIRMVSLELLAIGYNAKIT